VYNEWRTRPENIWKEGISQRILMMQLRSKNPKQMITTWLEKQHAQQLHCILKERESVKSASQIIKNVIGLEANDATHLRRKTPSLDNCGSTGK
jgi:hypothetical protein